MFYVAIVAAGDDGGDDDEEATVYLVYLCALWLCAWCMFYAVVVSTCMHVA